MYKKLIFSAFVYTLFSSLNSSNAFDEEEASVRVRTVPFNCCPTCHRSSLSRPSSGSGHHSDESHGISPGLGGFSPAAKEEENQDFPPLFTLPSASTSAFGSIEHWFSQVTPTERRAFNLGVYHKISEEVRDLKVEIRNIRGRLGSILHNTMFNKTGFHEIFGSRNWNTDDTQEFLSLVVDLEKTRRGSSELMFSIFRDSKEVSDLTKKLNETKKRLEEIGGVEIPEATRFSRESFLPRECA